MRERLAMALAGAATAYLAAMFFVSFGAGGSLDRFVLGAAAIAAAVFLAAWIVAHWLPRWVVLGFALVLIATGVGLGLTGGVDDQLISRAQLAPLAFGVTGMLMIAASLVHPPARRTI